MAEMQEAELRAVKMRRMAAEKLASWLSGVREQPSGK